MTRAVRAGMDFVSALDRGSLRSLAELCAPDATWWVDGGPDREGGDPEGTGSGRFPLHGVMRMDDKLALMRRTGPATFPTGCRQIPRRIIAGEDSCVIEVEGYGVHASGDTLVAIEATGDATLAGGARYQNRYLWVVDVREDGIAQVREYCDTLHIAELMA